MRCLFLYIVLAFFAVCWDFSLSQYDYRSGITPLKSRWGIASLKHRLFSRKLESLLVSHDDAMLNFDLAFNNQNYVDVEENYEDSELSQFGAEDEAILDEYATMNDLEGLSLMLSGFHSAKKKEIFLNISLKYLEEVNSLVERLFTLEKAIQDLEPELFHSENFDPSGPEANFLIHFPLKRFVDLHSSSEKSAEHDEYSFSLIQQITDDPDVLPDDLDLTEELQDTSVDSSTTNRKSRAKDEL